MTIKEACNILDIVCPVGDRCDSEYERAELFAKAKSNYIKLLKTNHPDVGGNHDDTIRIVNAFKFLQKTLTKRRLTYTELYSYMYRRSKERKSKHVRKVAKQRPLVRTVLQVDSSGTVIAAWKSMCAAARALNINQGSISKCCRGKAKSTGGFQWRYKYKTVS